MKKGGSRWPGGKISTPGPEVSRLEIRFDRRTAVSAHMVHVKSVRAKCPPVGIVRKFGEGSQLRCRPRHLTAIQNYKVRPKIALVLLQNGT
ncbi:hypothetical protein AVEN_12844-1 [Araneus ventricosus]|uniref:Uncharacterized protein n=1 Tax=Araneus ventricosus TaxID=182803 RepID=A0A4Y2EA78_ARAVE|nr:hypothetical protein AVEN_12844-1 [Araneus ventricosus]